MYPIVTLCADPPWKFGDKLPGKSRGAEKNYPCMSVQDIKSYPLPSLAESGFLYLWRVSSMVEEAYSVVRAWGFVPKTEIVWRKLTKNGKVHFGMGRYLRASHETCIVASRGKAASLVMDHGVRSILEDYELSNEGDTVLSDVVSAHSQKPESFYNLVERLTPGPYCELFSRQYRSHWLQYGLELPGGEIQPHG